MEKQRKSRPIGEIVGENIKKLRKKHSMSQAKLAEALNISVGCVSNYETGTRQPDYEKIEMIASFFNVTPAELYTENLNTDDLIPVSNASQFVRLIFSLAISDLVDSFTVDDRTFKIRMNEDPDDPLGSLENSKMLIKFLDVAKEDGGADAKKLFEDLSKKRIEDLRYFEDF